MTNDELFTAIRDLAEKEGITPARARELILAGGKAMLSQTKQKITIETPKGEVTPLVVSNDDPIK